MRDHVTKRAARCSALTAACVVSAAALVMISGGCGGPDEAAPTTAPRTVETAAPPLLTSPSTLPPGTVAPTAAPADTTVATNTSPPTPTASTGTASVPVATIDPAAAAVDWTAIVGEIVQRQAELPQNPSLAGVDELCAAASPCHEQWSATVQYLLDNGVRLKGGPSSTTDSVEFQETAGGVPLSEALLVVLIVRSTTTDLGSPQLVRDDGSVFQDVAPDPSIVVGSLMSRSLVLARDSVSSEWKLSQEGRAG